MDDQIIKLYELQKDLLESGKLGDGLWPIDIPLGKYLAELIKGKNLQSVLEVGAGVGYASLWMASALRETSGRLISYEWFKPKVEIWKDHFFQLFGSEYAQWAEVRAADVAKDLSYLENQTFDLIFLDGRKNDYIKHLQLLLPWCKKGSYFCADNVISHQKSCSNYLHFVRNNSNFTSFTLDVGAGLECSQIMVDPRAVNFDFNGETSWEV